MTLKKDVTLKSGRKVKLMELTGADSFKIMRVASAGFPENNSVTAAAAIMSMVRAAFSICEFEKQPKNGTLERRFQIKVLDDVDKLLNFFSSREVDEIINYVEELNSDNTPTSDEEVEDFVEDYQTEKK